jgi:hypothetical protein
MALIPKILVSLSIVLFGLFATAEWMIGSGVRDISRLAQKRHPGNRVEALLMLVECDSCEMKNRNLAIWALGQLDDSRVLPVLESYQTGKPCNHLKDVCQKTLNTALRHLRHEDNNRYESFLWRWMLPNESCKTRAIPPFSFESAIYEKAFADCNLRSTRGLFLLKTQ